MPAMEERQALLGVQPSASSRDERTVRCEACGGRIDPVTAECRCSD